MELTAEVLKPRLAVTTARHRVATLRTEYHHTLRQFRNCLPVEKLSRSAVLASIVTRVKEAVFRTKGREIDLIALLSSGWNNGSPGWALINPLHDRIGAYNGRVEIGVNTAVFTVFSHEENTTVDIRIHSENISDEGGRRFDPEPPAILPDRVRELAQKVARRTKWLGILYKPQGWKQPKADPALIVEWKGIPNRYFALAVWGADRARIEEYYQD